MPEIPVPGLDLDVCFGDAERPLPDWRESLPLEYDDNDEPTEEELAAVVAILGFDPTDTTDSKVGPSPFRKSFDTYSRKDWVTIGGGQCETGGGEHCGGTAVDIEGGKIAKGPRGTVGKKPNELKSKQNTKIDKVGPSPFKKEEEQPKQEQSNGYDGNTDFNNIGKLTSAGSLGGSTGAELMKDEDGSKWVIKRGANEAHLKEELSADEAYRALGIVVPDGIEDMDNHKPCKIAAFVKGEPIAKHLNDEKIKQEAQKGFVADALLGNWDVVGLESDNMLVTPDGKVVRIDNGGSLRYRARGTKKKSGQFGEAVTEIDSMRDPNVNESAAAVFAGITDAEIKRQVQDINEHANDLMNVLPNDLKDIVGRRLDWLVNKYVKGIEPETNIDKQQPDDYVGKTIKPSEHKTPKDLIESHKAYLNKLKISRDTQIELKHVRSYTDNGYVSLNKAMRKCPPKFDCLDKEFKQRLNAIESVIQKAPKFKTPVTVFRGIRTDAKKINDIIHQAQDSLASGKLYHMPSITSTTTRPLIADTWGGEGLLFRIKANSGLYVDSISANQGEREVIQSSKTKYKVVGIADTTIEFSDMASRKRKIIYLEEV